MLDLPALSVSRRWGLCNVFFFFFSWTFVSAPDLATHGNNLKLTLRTRRYGLREADVLSRNLALTSTRRVTFYGHSQTFTFTSNQYSVTSASWQIVLYLWQVFLSPRWRNGYCAGRMALINMALNTPIWNVIYSTKKFSLQTLYSLCIWFDWLTCHGHVSWSCC